MRLFLISYMKKNKQSINKCYSVCKFLRVALVRTLFSPIYERQGQNTCSHYDEEWQKPIRLVTIHFQDRRGGSVAGSRRYRNRDEIIVLMCC